MATRKIDLPQTKGEFKIAGNATGMASDKAFNCKNTKKGKPMNFLNIGVETNHDSTIYISLNGMEKDEVMFYKKAKEKGGKGETKKIKWANRYTFKEEGFKLIGINVGVTKKLNDKGQQVNDNKMMAEFDACEEIYNNIKDGNSLFVKGNIEFSSYKNDKEEVKRSTKFVPNQVSLAKDIDFDAEGFEETNTFKQTIVFTGIEMDESNKEDKKARVSAKIVTYDSIEDAEFIIREKGLFNNFKKNLKPYTSITVWGKILNVVEKEEVQEDVWGEENTFDKVSKPHIRELVITGADPSSIDKETYSEENIDKAIRALKEFGEDNKPSGDSGEGSWGTSENLNTGNDGDDEW